MPYTNGNGLCSNMGDDDGPTSTNMSTYGYSDIYTPPPALASSRYNRQMLVPSISLSGQQKIANSKVLIIGLGGLGAPAALYLAGAGVGRLGLLDDDVVELSNLHRQIVHRESSFTKGMSKVASAIKGCRELNGEVDLVPHEMRLDVSTKEKAEQVMNIVELYDIVLDCTDNPATRYLISDLCVLLEKTLVSGAAQRLEGQMVVLNYPSHDNKGRGPCYRCAFPNPPSPEMVKGCGEIGILGPVVGTIGTLMATETIRLLVKDSTEARKPTMLLYSAWPTDPRNMFRAIGLRGKRVDCISCGRDEDLQVKQLKKITRTAIFDGSMDYLTFCGMLEDVKLLTSENRIAAADFLATLAKDAATSETPKEGERRTWKNIAVIDVREPHEAEMGSRIKNSFRLPISTILRKEEAFTELSELFKGHEHDAVVFMCPQGNDSQVAVKRLLDWRAKKTAGHLDGQPDWGHGPNGTTNKVFIGDVIGGYSAIQRVISDSRNERNGHG